MPSMIALVYGFLSAGVLSWYLMVVTGLDRETTIHVGTTLSRYTICLTSFAFAAFALGACLTSTKNNRLLAGFRNANKTAWILSALLYASILTAACVWITGRMVRIAAQHSTGIVREVSASVKDIWHRGASRPGCAEEIAVELPTNSGEATFCVEMRWGSRIGPDKLMQQDRVRLRLRDTSFGIVVERVERITSKP